LKSLHIFPTKNHLVSGLAFIQQYGLFGDEIVLLDHSATEKEFLRIGAELGIKFITIEEATESTYVNLYCLPWFANIETPKIISKISFDYLYLYADGNRNTLYSQLVPIKKIKGLIYIEVEMRQESFINTMEDYDDLEVKVIKYSGIVSIYKNLYSQLSKVQMEARLGEGDLLLVMRYWGMPVMYPVTDLKLFEEMLFKELCLIPNVNRVIIRSDERSNSQDSVDITSLVRRFKDVGKQVLYWDNLFPSITDFPFINNPESVFINTQQSPEAIFAFDGTFNLVAGYLGLRDKLVWPSDKFIDAVIATRRSKNFIFEQILIMKKILFSEEIDSSVRQDSLVESLGYEIDSIFSEFNIGSLVDELNLVEGNYIESNVQFSQERDALTQERDALTQERDALTQERDALTQERDALANSTIWRLTGPLRKILNYLKN
jgi:hypothetical protein